MFKRVFLQVIFFNITLFSFAQNAVFFNIREGVLLSYSGSERDVSITEDLGVIEIGKNAFQRKNIRSINIPTTVKIINDSAFKDCNSLNTIVIPSSVVEIKNSSFYGCSALTNINISNGLISIGDEAFARCGISKIEIPVSVDNIGARIFDNCEKLSQIIVDKNNSRYYNDIEYVLFEKNTNKLICYPIGKTNTKYIVPNGVTSIGDYAFYNSRSLTEIELSSSVINIGKGSFSSCRKLVTVKLSNNLETIDENAFNECIVLKSINLPNTIRKIGIAAFAKCHRLENINIPPQLTVIENYTFNECYAIVSTIIIPDSVRTIGMYAFNNCRNIKEVIISTNVIEIKGAAFRGCEDLESITISRKTKYDWSSFDYENRLHYID